MNTLPENDMTAEQFYNSGLFNLDFMTEEERQTIYDATELYAKGKLRQAVPGKEEVYREALEKIKSICQSKSFGERSFDWYKEQIQTISIQALASTKQSNESVQQAAKEETYRNLLIEIDRSLYIGKDLDDTEILKWYIDVVTTIKEEIKEVLAGASFNSDAVEFGKWISKNDYFPQRDGTWNTGLLGKEYTTQELYNLFKQKQ